MAIQLLQSDGKSLENHARLLEDAQYLLAQALEDISSIGLSNEN